MRQIDTMNSPPNRAEGGVPQPRATLTCRERAIVRLLLRGWSNKRIAVELGISPYTVRDHVSAILVKFRLDNRVQLVAHFAVFPVGETHSG